MTTTSARPPGLSAIELIRERRQGLPPPARRREIREDAGLSRGDIARELGVSPTAVAWWEREDGYDPRVRHRIAYRKLLAALEAEVKQERGQGAVQE